MKQRPDVLSEEFDRDGSQDARSVFLIEKVRRILDCFPSYGPVLRTAEISRATGLPQTTCARLLKTMVHEGILEREEGRFMIGLRMLGWTSSAVRGSELVTAGEPVLQALRDATGETSCLFVRRGDVRICVAVVESTQAVIHRLGVGQVRPLHAGASGKIIMAYDRDVRWGGSSGIELVGLTPKTVTDPQLLEDRLRSIREVGYAVAHEEREIGLSSVGAPVFGPDGALAAAMAVGIPSFRLRQPDVEKIVPAVLRWTLTLSRRLGYGGPDTAGASRVPAFRAKSEREGGTSMTTFSANEGT